MALSHIALTNLKPKEKPFKVAFGEGLYVMVTPEGGKLWRFKYRIYGKEKLLTLGAFPYVGIVDAQNKRTEAKKLLAQNIDPSAHKKEEAAKSRAVNENTFELIAKDWHKQNLDGWTPRHADYVLRRLKLDVFPLLGKRPITEITPKEIIDVLRKVEERGAQELARRLKQTCSQIFRFAIIEDKTTTNPAATFFNKDALKPFAKGHYAALESRDIPAFLQALEKNEARLYPATRQALKLMMLTFVRTSELIGARWSELDLDNAEWLIPAERMKMRRPHIVPLSKQALAIFRELEAKRGVWGADVPDYVFANQVNPRKAMSNNTLLKAIERLGYKGKTTGHGFRAMAMSTIKEKLGYRHEVVDRQLAHAPQNKVDAAYDRAQFIDERRTMMQHWADYLDAVSKSDGKVVMGKFGRAA